MTPCFYGDIILWERPLQFWAEKILKPGVHVIDVGANVGGLTIAFARLVGVDGKVVGIEANPSLVESIKGDLQLNKVPQADIVFGAAFSEAGKTLALSVDPSYYASGSSVVYAIPDTKTVAVPSVTIDDVCAEKNLQPSLIKLDIEGAELEALKGGEKTLASYNPFLIFESTSAQGELFDWLAERGYVFFDGNTLEKAPHKNASRFPHNYVAIPNKAAFSPDLGETQHYRPNENWAQRFLGSRSRAVTFTPEGQGDDYLLRVMFEGDARGSGQLQVHDAQGRLMLMYHADFGHLSDTSCSSFPLSLPAKGAPYRVRIEPDAGAKALLLEVLVTPLKVQSGFF